MLYELIIFLASILGRVLSLFDKKLERFFSLRKCELTRVEEFFRNRSNKRILWFHSASAGEFEQAKPLIEYLSKNRSDVLIVASFYSPSGYDAGSKYDKIDFCFNLPLDYRKNTKRLLDCINPQIIIYSKYDVWTNLTVEAARKGIELILISGAIPKTSLRYRWPFRFFFARAYRNLSRIYAISEWDAQRFRKIIGCDRESIVIVSGDTRFDQVKVVVENIHINAKRIILKKDESIYIIAGSTYEASEKILIRMLKRLRYYGKDVRLVLVPHDVDLRNIQRLKKMIRSWGFVPVSFSNSKLPITTHNNEVLIVDAFGVLAALYEFADIVFVGGSYKGSVHSILEPAIFGKPILTGPFIDNAYEAIALKEIGGLKVCKGVDEFYQESARLIQDSDFRESVSGIVRDFFKNNLGATQFIIEDMKVSLRLNII